MYSYLLWTHSQFFEATRVNFFPQSKKSFSWMIVEGSSSRLERGPDSLLSFARLIDTAMGKKESGERVVYQDWRPPF